MAVPTVQPVIDALRKNRVLFETFCRSLSEEELGRPVPPDNKWTVQDFIIHNLTFDDLMTGWAESVTAGSTGAPAGPNDEALDVDAWNQEHVEHWRGKTLDEVFAASVPGRTRFEAALSRLTDANMGQIVQFPGDNKRDPAKVQFGLFLHGVARHDPIHAADMLKALPERASDPELQAWLDDRMVEWYQRAMSGPAKR